MADSNIVTQDEMALRRRARRRLVGAVAIALIAVVALPMLFDPEPKPLGPEVDIRIPAKDSPFDPVPGAPAVVPTTPAAPEPSAAEPTQPLATAELVAPETSKATAEMKPTEIAPVEKAAEPRPAKPAQVGPAKPEAAEGRMEKKPADVAKPASGADGTSVSRGFYLQLGSFGSEANARQLQEKVQAAGFKVGLIGANGQFRVRVGPISEHSRALELQAKLKAKGFNPVLLGS